MSSISPITRCLYGWLQDDKPLWERVRILKAEALEDIELGEIADRAGAAETLAFHIKDAVLCLLDGLERTMANDLALRASQDVDYDQIGTWVLRDDVRFPKGIPGKLEEDE